MPTFATSQFLPPKSWEDLELLVWRLFKSIWNDPYTLRHGRLGQAQHGVDVFGRPRQGDKWDGIQVKGKDGFFGRPVTEQELRSEVEKAKGFIPPLENYILVTSARRDQQIQQVAREITQENAESGRFGVAVLAWEDIEERLAEFPDVIREHYPEITGVGNAASSSQSELPQGFLMEQLRELIQPFLVQSGTADVGPAASTVPPSDGPPLNPSPYVSRQETLDRIGTELDGSSWIALVGSTGMGKTLLAKSIWESKPGNARYWISFSGQEGLYETHLELQLLRAVIMATGDEALLENFRLGRLGEIEITRLIGALVASNTMLVFDDLPNLAENDNLRERLSSVAVAWWNAGGKVLSTSQYQIPISVSNLLGPELTEFIVPELVAEEVNELLAIAGSPLAVRRPMAQTIVGLTKGHPVLVAAAIQWLLRNNWGLDEQTLGPLFSGDAFTQPMREARTQVRRLVTSDFARDLLDRLSMLNQSFDRDMIWAVANVPPVIDRPIEQFTDLVGPWIQPRSDSRYLVSPLLQSVWEEYISADLQLNIHRAIAQQYLLARPLSIDGAYQIALHLEKANEWLQLGGVLFHVMAAIETPLQFEQGSWVLWFFRPEDSWPDEVPYPIRIVIRSMQVRGLLLMQKSVGSYQTDLEQLIEHAGPENSLAVFFAYYQTSFLLEHLSPEVTARRAILGARAFHAAEKEIPSDITIQPEEAFWGAIIKVKELTHISGIIEVIREMTDEERRIVFAPHIGTDMTIMLVDMCYAIEADVPTDVQDWDKVFRLLEQIVSAGELEGAAVLSWAAVRAQAIALADYQHDAQAALKVLHVDDSGVQSSHRFLLVYTEACILLSQNETRAAFEKFDDALSISVEDFFPFLLSDALGRGMVAASKVSRFDLSILWAARSLKRGTNEVGVGHYEKIEMLGELAWAHWSAGDHKKACGAMYGAVSRLLEEDQTDVTRHREVWAKVGHVLGWLAGKALTGTPPEATIDGQPYTVPYPGLIYLRAKQDLEFDDISRLHYLPSQLAMMASGVGLPNLAAKAYSVAAKLGRAKGYFVFSATMDLERAPIEAELGHFDQALAASLSGIKAVPIIQANDGTALGSTDNPEELWESVDIDQKRSIESFHIYYEVILPAFASLVARGVNHHTARKAVMDLTAAIERMGTSLLLTERWQGITNHMARTFDPASNRAEITHQLETLEDGEIYERLTLYIALATHSQRTPSDMSGFHAIVLTHLTSPRSNNTVVDNIVRWIIRSWQNEAETRAFRLNSPGCQGRREIVPAGRSKTIPLNAAV